MKKYLFIVGFSTVLLSACTTSISEDTLHSPKTTPEVKQYCFEDLATIGEWNDFKLTEGGFSGIYFIPGTDLEFYMINDRGPNIPMSQLPLANGREVKVFPFPAYAQKLVHFKLSDGKLSVLQTHALRYSDEQGFSGLPVPGMSDSHKEHPWSDMEGTPIPLDNLGVDIEALVFENDSIYWFVDEYRPSLWRMDLKNNRCLAVYQPSDFSLPATLSNRRPNRGFEGVAYADGKIYAIMQSAMWNPDKTVEKNSRLTRLIELEIATGKVNTYIYEMPDKRDDVRIKDWKIGDMVALGNQSFLVLEHGSKGDANFVDVYKINLSEATAIPSNYTEKKPLELYWNATELRQETGMHVVQKTHVVDLLAVGYDLSLGKPEGLTFIDAHTLVVLNDNDYGIASPKEDGHVVATGIPTCLTVIRFPSSLFE